MKRIYRSCRIVESNCLMLINKGIEAISDSRNRCRIVVESSSVRQSSKTTVESIIVIPKPINPLIRQFDKFARSKFKIRSQSSSNGTTRTFRIIYINRDELVILLDYLFEAIDRDTEEDESPSFGNFLLCITTRKRRTPTILIGLCMTE